ncbi:hybrid sensor histidine kinase/response regulator [Clostridium sp. CM028]|uniref:hybrid sensor histidine kinase/response regulator n=1 Tax=Clostridium sp. CM028 TaxID=2851575 RepID=UPI001C6E9170|nr:hybrid sensor histidine kinase/response regulator [Clostridium sp. CM028]MBW9150469.1 hybrid sensor histidine kinase/response regulator [Clostridium sp. CM028]WLC60679.1 hybrid sensor histidine kinase/response regulator [Clostridium sp. CM028]
MKYTNNNLYKAGKNSLCIGTDSLNINNLPKVIIKNISDALINGEKIIFFTDDIFYKNIEKNFDGDEDFIRHNINEGIFKIKTYNIDTFDYDYREFLDIIFVVRQKLRIVWDFKNVIRRVGKVDVLIKCVQKIIECSKDNISNMIYINNNVYNFNELHRFSNLFQTLIIIDRNKEMEFKNKGEIEKAIWMLQSNSQLKYQNKNLVLFNDIFSDIPQNTDENKFREIVMNKIKAVCDVDFCILHSSVKEQKNAIELGNYYGITKKHKYYLIKDIKTIHYINSFNEMVLNSNGDSLLNLSEIEDSELVEKFKLLGIVSYMAINVEYYDSSKGVICIGRYKNNRELSKNNIEHLKSICKTAFYLIQDQKRFSDMRNRLIQNEKLRAMGEMAAGITHDINNILTPIVGSVQLLKDKTKEKENLKLISIIEICAYDGINITNKVKKLTQKCNGKDNDFEIFSVDNVISDAIDLTKSKWLTGSSFKGIKISIIKSLKSNEEMQGNITEIREVFINIIVNAIDAMPKGGKIEFITKNKANMAIIEIRDSGMGMKKEIQKRIFEPFFTTKGNDGSGLGLSISYNIILSHKGSMEIESKQNVGTSFIIKLPLCEKITKSDDVGLRDVIDFEGNILVIDDQEQIRNVVASMIKSIVKCKTKACGCENLDSELQRRKYDIIVCDFTMPSINGFQVAEKVKKINNQTYFCLMTGWVGSFEGQDMNNVDFILNKPINKESLKKMLSCYSIRD